MTYVFRPHDPPGICARCEKKVHVSELRKEWTGLRVCHDCFDFRNAQDFVRGVRDKQMVPGGALPEPADVFGGTTVYRREDTTAYLRESDVAATPLYRED